MHKKVQWEMRLKQAGICTPEGDSEFTDQATSVNRRYMKRMYTSVLVDCLAMCFHTTLLRAPLPHCRLALLEHMRAEPW